MSNTVPCHCVILYHGRETLLIALINCPFTLWNKVYNPSHIVLSLLSCYNLLFFKMPVFNVQMQFSNKIWIVLYLLIFVERSANIYFNINYFWQTLQINTEVVKVRKRKKIFKNTDLENIILNSHLF